MSIMKKTQNIFWLNEDFVQTYKNILMTNVLGIALR